MKNITKSKKILSFVLTLCMTLSLFTTTQIFAKEYDTSKYNANDVAAINALMKAAKFDDAETLANSPSRWYFAYWDDSTPKRVTGLSFGLNAIEGTADFSKLSELTNLSISQCSLLKIVNIKGLSKLSEFFIENCYNLTSLDLTGCTALTKLECTGNELKSLDVSKSPLLTVLICHSNQITSLDVTGFTHLTQLICFDNKLTTLKTRGTSSLNNLECQNNYITSLDISNMNLEHIDCSYNKMLSIDAITFTNPENVESGFTLFNFEPQNVTLTATPTASKVLVNGKSIAFDAYTINGNNYFKLRDLANVLSGTGKQFEVTWNNEEKAINLLSGMPYTSVGGELASGDGKIKTAVYSTSTLFVDDGMESTIAFTIGNNNYFKLRDIMEQFNVGVGWDKATSTITIDTSTDYITQ